MNLLCWYWVKARCRPRMTTADSLYGEPSATKRTESFNCFTGIHGTCWMITTISVRVQRTKPSVIGWQRRLVDTNKKNEWSFHVCGKSRARNSKSVKVFFLSLCANAQPSRCTVIAQSNPGAMPWICSRKMPYSCRRTRFRFTALFSAFCEMETANRVTGKWVFWVRSKNPGARVTRPQRIAVIRASDLPRRFCFLSMWKAKVTR